VLPTEGKFHNASKIMHVHRICGIIVNTPCSLRFKNVTTYRKGTLENTYLSGIRFRSALFNLCCAYTKKKYTFSGKVYTPVSKNNALHVSFTIHKYSILYLKKTSTVYS
jgi:hypothetical protein